MKKKRILRNEKKSGFCEMKKIWNLRNEPTARNSTDCILFKISKIVIGPKYNSQVTNYNVCLFQGTIKNGIKGWHILSNILILCQNSLAKPHWKFFSEPRKKLYGNQSFAFYPNCTDLVQFLLPWTFLYHNINHVALV